MMRPRLAAARELLDERGRDLRQHRRQRGGVPAAADGRGVRRAELPRPGRGQPQPEGPAARARVRDEPRVPARLRQGRPRDAARREQHRHRAWRATSRSWTRRAGDTGTCRCATPTRSSTRSPRAPCTSRCTATRRAAWSGRGRSRAAIEIEPVFGDGKPAVWRWSRPLIDERGDDLVCRRIKGRHGRAGRRLPAGLAAPRRYRAAAARSCARSGWPRRSARPTPRWPSSRRSSATSSSRPSRPAWCGGSSRRCRTTSLVLDFFAGSGTTGHAVALANEEDGGTRRCISVNSAEPTREGSNARNAGLLTVADITRARLRAVAARHGGGLDERP